mgnify:CR=1 FL=1
MLLPDNIKPENSIYYNGALVLKIVQREKHISVADLYIDLRKQIDLSFSTLLLSLDWLFLIDCVVVQDGEVSLCS